MLHWSPVAFCGFCRRFPPFPHLMSRACLLESDVPILVHFKSPELLPRDSSPNEIQLVLLQRLPCFLPDIIFFSTHCRLPFLTPMLFYRSSPIFLFASFAPSPFSLCDREMFPVRHHSHAYIAIPSYSISCYGPLRYSLRSSCNTHLSMSDSFWAQSIPYDYSLSPPFYFWPTRAERQVN